MVRETTWHERAEKIVNRICKAFPAPEFENWDLCEELILSSIAACEQISKFGIETENAAQLLNQTAYYLREKGKYEYPEPFLLRSIAIYEKILGKNHSHVATGLNNLAELYRELGKYKEAEPLYQRSLAIWESILGEKHPTVALSLNNLAELYRIQGKYEQTEPLYQRSLAIREKLLGKDHPSVAQSLNNLAELYRIQGKYNQSEPLCQRSLAIREKILGSNHPDIASSLNNLAEIYRTQGKYEQAEPLYQRSLAIWENALGANHPRVASSLNNLALLYDAQGKYEQAEPLYQKSLVIWEKNLGKDHPDVASSLNNLALLYYAQGKYEQAESLYQRSLAIRKKTLGKDHPSIALSLNNLAGLYDYQGKYEQAEPLYQRSLSIWEKALGKNHPTTQTIRNNLQQLQAHCNRTIIVSGGNNVAGRDVHIEYTVSQKIVDNLQQELDEQYIKLQEYEDIIANSQQELRELKSELELRKDNIDKQAKAFLDDNKSESKLKETGNLLKEELDNRLQLVESEFRQKLLIQECDFLKRENELREKQQSLFEKLLEKAIEQRPVTITNENNSMIDKGRHQSFSGNNNNNVNFGDNNILTSTIQQLPAEHSELKNLLSQLQMLINNSTLPDCDKKEALTETKTIAEVVKQPKEEQQSVVRRTLRYFKGLSAELEGIPEATIKWGKTVAQIASFFGI